MLKILAFGQNFKYKEKRLHQETYLQPGVADMDKMLHSIDTFLKDTVYWGNNQTEIFV